ncbi:recombinase family protein [Salipaludibacillus sp. CF4.18]|uniref:recombinase family protein n=1 Tax=Salipaludibacillus sp. CF4.18 TaxID=3373081 RepID=UPI003EE78014
MKCAVYIRVSTDKEEQKTSLDNQQQFFYNILAEKGWELYEFYIDVQSGTKDKKRENLRRLIKDAKARKFDVILSKELSRLARNGKLSYEIKDIAENNNVHIITYDNAINSIEGNIHMFGLYAWVYEQESQRTSERIKAALNTKAKRGEFIGSNAPYGYKIINKKLVLAEDYTPTVVRQIFKLYMEGKGLDGIARTLSKDGYSTPARVAEKKNNAGHYWHGSSVKGNLTNPHYIGDLVQQRETTRSVTSESRQKQPQEKHVVLKQTHSAIISHEDFEAVKQLMKSRKKNVTKGKKHLYTNILFCADCGTGMWYKQNRDGYICGRYSKHGKGACTHHAIKEKDLNHIFLSDMEQKIDKISDDLALNKLDLQAKKKQKQYHQHLKIVDEKIVGLKSKKRRYLDLLANDLIFHDDYREVANIAQEEIEKLIIKRSDHLASLQDDNYAKKAENLKKLFSRFLPLNEVTNEMLHYFVERIDVERAGRPIIKYRFSILNA